MTRIQLDYLKHLEDVRSNKAREAEDKRHNVVNEHLGYENVRVNEASVVEAGRHNLVTEAETQRSNVVREGLERNKQAVDRRIRSEELNLKRDQHLENVRHNVNYEDILWAQARANQTSANAAAKQAVNSANQVASNDARWRSELIETQTHNANMERLKEIEVIGGVGSRAATTILSMAGAILTKGKMAIR